LQQANKSYKNALYNARRGRKITRELDETRIYGRIGISNLAMYRISNLMSAQFLPRNDLQIFATKPNAKKIPQSSEPIIGEHFKYT
jgi:hypothetical protein